MEVFVGWAGEVYANYGPRVLTGVATLIVGVVVAKVIRVVLRRVLRGTGVERTLADFITNLSYVAVLVLVVTTALDHFGVPPISYAAILGAAGLAIGLALKNTLSDFAAGVMLIALRPFKTGDRIEAAGASGVVTSIKVFATTIHGPDDKRMIVPNSKITGGTIVNLSAN